MILFTQIRRREEKPNQIQTLQQKYEHHQTPHHTRRPHLFSSKVSILNTWYVYQAQEDATFRSTRTKFSSSIDQEGKTELYVPIWTIYSTTMKKIMFHNETKCSIVH